MVIASMAEFTSEDYAYMRRTLSCAMRDIKDCLESLGERESQHPPEGL